MANSVVFLEYNINVYQGNFKGTQSAASLYFSKKGIEHGASQQRKHLRKIHLQSVTAKKIKTKKNNKVSLQNK